MSKRVASSIIKSAKKRTKKKTKAGMIAMYDSMPVAITHPQIVDVEEYIRAVQEADLEEMCRIAVPKTSIVDYVPFFHQNAKKFLHFGDGTDFTFNSLILKLVLFPKSLSTPITKWMSKKTDEGQAEEKGAGGGDEEETRFPLKCCWVKNYRLYVVKPLLMYYMRMLWDPSTDDKDQLSSNMKANGYMCCRIYTIYHSEIGIYHPPEALLNTLHSMAPETYPPVDKEHIRSLVGIRRKGHECDCPVPRSIDSTDPRNVMVLAAMLGTTPAEVAAAAPITAVAAASAATTDPESFLAPPLPALSALTASSTTIPKIQRQIKMYNVADRWPAFAAIMRMPIHITYDDVNAFRRAIDVNEFEELIS